MTVLLAPANERKRSAADLATVVGQELGASTPCATIRTALPNPFGFGGFGGQAIQIAVDGPDPDTLNDLVSRADRSPTTTASVQSPSAPRRPMAIQSARCNPPFSND